MTTRVLVLVYVKGISLFHEHSFCIMLPLNYSRTPYYYSNTCINSRIKWESKRFYGKREHVQKPSWWGNCSVFVLHGFFVPQIEWLTQLFHFLFIHPPEYVQTKKEKPRASLFSPILYFLSSPFLAMCQMLTMVATIWKECMPAYIGVRLTLFCSDTAHEGKTRKASLHT